MPAVSKTSTPLQAQQVTRTSFAQTHRPLRPVFTHGLPSAASHAAAVLLPCGSGARLLRDPQPSTSWDRPVEDDTTSSVALSPDASRFVVAARSGLVDFARVPAADDDSEEVPQLHRRFRPFENSVVAISRFDASGGLVALAALEGDVRVFDFDQGFCTHSFQTKHQSPITEVAFHPDPKRMLLFVGMEDGSVAEFSMSGKRPTARKTVNNHVSAVTGFAFVKDGESVVTVGRDKVLCIADTADMTHRKLVSCQETLSSVVAPRGMESEVVFTAGEKGVVRAWEAATGRERAGEVLALPFAEASYDAKANLDNGDERDEDKQDDDLEVFVTSMSLCGSERLVVSLSDHTLFYIPVSIAGKLSTVTQYVCGNLEEIYDIRALNKRVTNETERNSRDFAIASNSACLWVMRLQSEPKLLKKHQEKSTSKQVFVTPVDDQVDAPVLQGHWSCNVGLRGHRGIILSVDSLTNAKAIGEGDMADSYIASSSRDKTARVWRRSRASGFWSCMAIAEGHMDAIGSVAISPRTNNGQFFIVTGAADRTIKLWSLDQARKVANKRELADGHADATNDSKEGHASGGDAGEGIVTSLSAKWTMLAHEKDVNAIAVSPDAQCIATGSQDKTLKIWDAARGTLRSTCHGHRRGIWSVTFSQVDRIVATGSGDASVRIWSVQNGTCLRTLQGHLSGVLKSVFISNGTQLASSGADGLVKVWSTKSGECQLTVDAHEDRAWALDSVEDGQYLISGGADGLAAMWKDCTAERALAAVEKREEEALMGQVVSNAARARKWSVAVRGALELGLTQKLRSILTDLILTTGDADMELIKLMKSLVGDEDKTQVKGWELVAKMFMACRDWNATGGPRNASIAARVLQAMFTVWGPDVLCDELVVDKRGLVEALQAHCSRHLERVSAFVGKISILEHTLESMRALADIENIKTPKVGTRNAKRGKRASEEQNEVEGGKGVKRKRKGRDEYPVDY